MIIRSIIGLLALAAIIIFIIHRKRNVDNDTGDGSYSGGRFCACCEEDDDDEGAVI